MKHVPFAAKDANIIGILAGTLGVANYLDIIKRTKGVVGAKSIKRNVVSCL